MERRSSKSLDLRLSAFSIHFSRVVHFRSETLTATLGRSNRLFTSRNKLRVGVT